MKLKNFFNIMYEKSLQNDIFSMANAVTYKLILGIFPFVIFLMTFIGFFHINVNEYIVKISPDIPEQIKEIIKYFVNDVINVKSLSLLSTSLFLALYSSTSAIHQMIKEINKLFSVNETRGFLLTRLISLLLVVVYTALIIISMYGFIFGDKINQFLIKIKIFNEVPVLLDNLANIFFSFGLIFLFIILLYKCSVNKYVTLKQLMPGVFFTITVWWIASKLFNIYIDNFSKYSVIYGSIGAIFIFALWINLLTYVILFGAQINSVLIEME